MFALADLDDARHLVEKIVAIGGEATAEVAELRYVAKAPRLSCLV